MDTTDSLFTERIIDGAIAPHLGPRGRILTGEGICLAALPPGEIDLRLARAGLLIEIAPEAGTLWHHSRLDGQPHPRMPGVLDSVAAYAPGRRLQRVSTNTRWTLVVELAAERLADAASSPAPLVPARAAFDEYRDPRVGALARRAIGGLRSALVGPHRLHALAMAIVRHLSRHLARTRQNVAAGGAARRVALAMAYADARLHERLTVPLLADVAAMSPTWFATSFRAVTGRTVQGWVMQRRLERAWHLLRATDHSLVHVADACGFSSQAHLTTRFRESYGTSPGAWRAEPLE